MKKIMIAAAVVGLGLGFAKASTNGFIGRAAHSTNRLQAAKAENKNTTVCYELCDLDGNCYTECSVISGK